MDVLLEGKEIGANLTAVFEANFESAEARATKPDAVDVVDWGEDLLLAYHAMDAWLRGRPVPEETRAAIRKKGFSWLDDLAKLPRLRGVLMMEPDRLTIVMGDMNEWLPGSRTLRWLHRRLGRSPAPRTFPAIFPLLPLDRIWVWPRRALLSIRAHDSPAARSASDHLPVSADIAALPLVTDRMPALEAPPSP